MRMETFRPSGFFPKRSWQEKHGNKTTPWQAMMPMLDVKGVGQTLSSLNSILMIFCNFSEGFFLPKKTPGFIYALKNQALERGNAIWVLGVQSWVSTKNTDSRLIGTHERADISSEKVTGLLGLADALRLRFCSLGVVRLVELKMSLSFSDDCSILSMPSSSYIPILETGLLEDRETAGNVGKTIRFKRFEMLKPAQGVMLSASHPAVAGAWRCGGAMQGVFWCPWFGKRRDVFRILWIYSVCLFAFICFFVCLDLFVFCLFEFICFFVCLFVICTQGMGTVPYYAIIDTGLTYRGVNPATGWTGERCVLLATWTRANQKWTLTRVKIRRQPLHCKRFHPLLVRIVSFMDSFWIQCPIQVLIVLQILWRIFLPDVSFITQVRQRQSRLFDAYDGMNFSGSSMGFQISIPKGSGGKVGLFWVNKLEFGENT